MRGYRKLLAYAKPYRGSFISIFLLALISAALVALQPWPMKLVVDHLLGSSSLPPSVQSIFETFLAAPGSLFILTCLVLASLLFASLHLGAESLSAWLWTKAGRRMVYDLAEALFSRLQRRSLIFHSRNRVGDVMSRIATDSWCIYFVLDTLLIMPLHALLAMAGMIVLMAQLDGALTLVALATAPVVTAASFFVGEPLRAVARLRREMESRLAAHVQQTLAGIPVVQAFSQEKRERNRFQEFAEAAIRAQQRSALLGGINSLSSGLVTTLGAGAILWLGAQHVAQGTLTVGSLLVFLAYLTAMQAQMKTLANTYTALQGFGSSVDRVMEVLEGKPEVTDAPSAPALSRARGEVRIEGVAFGYEPNKPVLRGITLEAKPGETIALVGESGAGKSTLVSLIPRFFDPWEGRVLMDGHDIRSVQLKSLRAQIALVLQEPFLFPMSIAENIAYAQPDASRAGIEAAAAAANALSFIERLPEGYETVIGERGATLSGGERQRLSLARAFLKDAPVLILDEPTSALDSQTEKLVLEALARLQEGRTTFLIAHRLSTVRRASRIVVLQGGQITEAGTHDELLAREQAYARLCRLQFEAEPEQLPAPI
jgi:ATP-binding cassette subfamily B protein/subfamily B ATP-binding cassette protein MsbA